MPRSTVLVVEDEEQLRLNLALIARGCGFDVITVADGEEGAAALSTASIDIVLTDLLMPRLDGYGLIRWMASRKMVQPVLVISGYNSIESAIEALRLGAYDYITKPFGIEDVEAALRRAEASVEGRRADAALRQRNRELAAINAISAAVSSSLDLDEVLTRALGVTVETLELVGALIYLGDNAGLRRYRAYGQLTVVPDQVPPQLPAPCDRTIAIGEIQVAQLIGDTGHTWHPAESLKAAIPLLSNGSLCGLLLLVGNASQSFQHDQLALLESIGNYVGVAITNARLYSQLRDLALNLERQVAQRTRELANSRDLLRTVFDGIPSGMVLVDTAGQVLATNRAYARLLNQPLHLLIGRSYRQIWQSVNDESMATLLDDCIAVGQPVYQRHRLERPGLSPVVLDHYLFPVRDAHKVIQVIEYIEDVTERLALERVLAETEQLAALGRLAATVAHEVNTPLLAIRGCLGLIADPRSSAATRTEYVALAESELDRAAGIIRSMLDFYRSSGNEWLLVDINNIVEKVSRLLRGECLRRNVEVDLRLAPELPPVRARADQLKQVLLNLMLNAIEALDGGGQITFRTSLHQEAALPSTDAPPEPRRPTVMIQVEDNGAGVPESLQEKIFDAFVSTKPNGNGLGLVVCRTIVRDHGGSIAVANLPGGGAQFTVLLPAEPGSHQPRSAHPGHTYPPLNHTHPV